MRDIFIYLERIRIHQRYTATYHARYTAYCYVPWNDLAYVAMWHVDNILIINDAIKLATVIERSTCELFHTIYPSVNLYYIF